MSVTVSGVWLEPGMSVTVAGVRLEPSRSMTVAGVWLEPSRSMIVTANNIKVIHWYAHCVVSLRSI